MTQQKRLRFDNRSSRQPTNVLKFWIALLGLVPGTICGQGILAADSPGSNLCAVSGRDACCFTMQTAQTDSAARGVSGAVSEQRGRTSGRAPEHVDITPRTLKQLFSNVIQDQKTAIKFPLQLMRGQHWKPFLAFTAVTASLVALDPHDSPYFRRTSSFRGFNRAASGINTGLGMALVPAAVYLVAAKRGDSYGKQTVFLAAQAAADTQILTFAMKMVDRRIRPIDVRRGGNYADTWFDADVFGGKTFPSGHTMTAFALADVFTERYRNHRWVPWVAYALASGVGFSRLTLQAHFPSDVFAGAVLGTVLAHFVVLHH
ncbi:MAG: phosphatase PAP2 family protein [Bryobacteraceae bacterium]